MKARSLLLKNELTLELLWQQFTKGDMGSFHKIYKANYQHLYNFGLNYLEPNEVEDCIQNLFLYILQHRKSIAIVNNVEAYLFISFRNQIRKTNKSNKIVFQQIDSRISIADQNTYSIKESMLNELHFFLKKLSPRENEIIALKYYQGFKNIEIADSLGIEYQTVRNTLNNAIKKLRKLPFQAF